ncbi:GntR family transcriptional regulator [Acuticoccus sp. I52.16.1]|uniref:GntR family transcriptional regulator n=1 Tax=Acuticoccus sp. I52.16.1 TaxID=2928472 RepID=UPI001FCF8CAE|nr:GntR family transcriptional regulator [Acuticoccus sp. I52.16.1]UOM35200.1 GntR family transcriptional regulator [Acuticoccus sp. I52.16.1]
MLERDSAPLGTVVRHNLTQRVYSRLRTALLEGQFEPGHRFKIRALAESMGVSETPIREALMQLVRERGLEMQAARSITVAGLTLEQYLELREIRILLEGLAGERATARITDHEIGQLERHHTALIAAEQSSSWREAIRANWQFHSSLFQAAQMPELQAILEGIWLRNGPLMNALYPDARPTYPGRHQHLNVLDALRRRDGADVRKAVQADLMEGGAGLVAQLGHRAEADARPKASA